VIGVGEVFSPAGFIFEGDDEGMGEAFVLLFAAVVDAPGEGLDRGNLTLESDEGLLDGGDAFFGGVGFELEADDVVKLFAGVVGGIGGKGGGGGHSGKDRGKREKKCGSHECESLVRGRGLSKEGRV